MGGEAVSLADDAMDPRKSRFAVGRVDPALPAWLILPPEGRPQVTRILDKHEAD